MKPIGILGGGQLARMMALKAHEMGLPVAVLSEKPTDPAAQVTSLWRAGSLSSRAVLENFMRECSLVTFESEFMDARLLEELEASTGTQVLPRPNDMARIQDRLSQKTLLLAAKVPTADFISVTTQSEADAAFEKFKRQVVFKKRRFGYDGYGTFVVKTPAELSKFKTAMSKDQFGFIAEQFVPFRRELAVMIARDRRGNTHRLPFVETFQENSRCLWVKGPLKEDSKFKKLGQRLEALLGKIGYVGIMGVELFETRHGILVNELAPRVHNSGHYSLDALFEDQFSIHLKAILGLQIGPPRPLAKGFAMYNLLGHSMNPPKWKSNPAVRLHWYGKNETRPGRKMGHINALGKTPEEALRTLKKRAHDFNL